MRKTLSDPFALFTLNEYTINNNTWNAAELTYGTDYTQSIRYESTDLTHNLVFEWNFNVPFKPSIYSYPEIMVGYSPWGNLGSKALTARISDLKNFDVPISFSVSGDTDNFSAAFDLWLTKTPGQGSKGLTTELMVWLHNGELANGITPTTHYSSKTFSADVIVHENWGDGSGNSNAHWRYIAVIPDKDYLSTTVDLDAILRFLVAKGYVSASDYVTGFEFGNEIARGAGSMTIKSLSYDFSRYGITNGNDVLTGTAQNDVIDGKAGADRISGASGNDTITGGSGHDILTGGTGRDHFVFTLRSSTSSDHITDFKPGADRIDLSSSEFRGLPKGSLANDRFSDDGHITSKTRFIYEAKNGHLSYDADGKGSADKSHLIAILDNHADLSAGDLWLI